MVAANIWVHANRRCLFFLHMQHQEVNVFQILMMVLLSTQEFRRSFRVTEIGWLVDTSPSVFIARTLQVHVLGLF